MRKNNIRKLIKALESGAFNKAVGALHRSPVMNYNIIPLSLCDANSSHCCLGVAECIMPASQRGGLPHREEIRQITDEKFHSPRARAICRWLGLVPCQIADLMSINDGTSTFDKVIEYLKQLLEKEE